MDNLSDSFRSELDSVTSTDSLHLIADEFQLRHVSTPDVSNIELSKRVALLELENERLRIDLENVRIDLNARLAANQGLKGKVTELYVEVQSVLQEKQKIQNALTDVMGRLSTAESSAKWYQAQLHNLQANHKALQVEVDTYQGILRQKQQSIASVTAKYKELDADYTKLTRDVQQHCRDKQELRDKIRNLQSVSPPIDVDNQGSLSRDRFQFPDLSTKLESTENELRGTKAELMSLEQKLLGNEVASTSMRNLISKQQTLISSMEENVQRCESEKNEIAEKLRVVQLEVQKLRSENDILQSNLISSKAEQGQIEDAILQLRTQLTKMIAQYKLLKSRNAEAEERLMSLQDLIVENKKLKALSFDANTSLIRKLRQEKRKVKNLERKLQSIQSNSKSEIESSLRDCLKQALLRNKDLKDQLKSLTKSSDESIDEGYGDCSILSSGIADIPTTVLINSALLTEATDVLLRSKDLFSPVHAEVNELQFKIEQLQRHYVPKRQ